LIAQKYTNSKILVANGGSASGAIAAAAITQQPALFGAAVIDRPILDLVRFDRFTAGPYWKPEFGAPSDAAEFKVLYSYSPYHRLRVGVCYPPTLVMIGDKDQVADPSHAYKFTARLQSAQGCDRPVLLKVMWGAGHNFGSTPKQVVDSWTDAMAFLVKELKLKAPETWPVANVPSSPPPAAPLGTTRRP
jgi:prolyl oligopeptidase